LTLNTPSIADSTGPGGRHLARHLGALRVGPRLLAAGADDGPLRGVAFVVKDLIDVAGTATGAGNPTFLADSSPAETHAPAVTRLLDAGASVIAKSHTDELAFSLAGTNVHYGTPRNPAAPGRIPGGSSSGSASAVAGGLVALAMGTDTGGSIRVPASYCGVFGYRPTHGRVPVSGVVALAPSFDAVGLLAASAEMLAAAGAALLNVAVTGGATPSAVVVAADLVAEADPAVAAAVSDAAGALAGRFGVALSVGDLSGGRLVAWLAAFRDRQMVEAWRHHGPWIEHRQPDLGPGVARRFAQARETPALNALAAGPAGEEVRAAIEDLLALDAVLVIPSAATVAPPAALAGPAKDELRRRTLTLTCVAGLGGLPVVGLPMGEVGGLPVGVSVIGRRGDDELLLAAAANAFTPSGNQRRRSRP